MTADLCQPFAEQAHEEALSLPPEGNVLRRDLTNIWTASTLKSSDSLRRSFDHAR